MTPRLPHSARSRFRSGITLTEILISILIMGVGLISLATLFPLGLVRLREAARQSRSGLLAESAAADMGAKNLLDKSTFAETYYGGIDPFLFDANPAGVVTVTASVAGGLPVCYDPLWRSVTGTYPALFNLNFPSGSFPANSWPGGLQEARFGAGVIGFGANHFLRADPDGNPASAYGLQRITNFVPYAPLVSWGLIYANPNLVNPITLRDLAAETFVSPEDLVMQNAEQGQVILNNPNNSGIAGGVVPEFFVTGTNANGTPKVETRSDWKYTWFFTGRQTDVTNGSVFDGDIVVCDSRPFSLDSILSPLTGTSSNVASGEQVLEAIFGYSATVFPTAGPGYGVAADRTVLLRWPTGVSDPEIKTGSWIADVTYERNAATSTTRVNNALTTGTLFSYQRCHWYQVAKKGGVVDELLNGVAYRRMTVYVNTPLKSRTLLFPGGSPVHLNAALFMPSVINVFPKTFYTR